MSRDKSCCIVCSRGFYSCLWKPPRKNKSEKKKRKCACCWFSAVTLISLLSLCWIYITFATFNDQEDINWKGFTILKKWVNWFMVVIIISAVFTSYCVLLQLFALFQVALGEPLNLHWLHKILLFFGAIFIIIGITGMSLKWTKEWPIVPLSLQATAPFLQFGAVGALTLLSPFVFRGFHMSKKKCPKFLIAVMFVVVSAAIFLCPLFIHSPCLIEVHELPEKPKLIGHRGAPMLAPENTMMSFNRSIACGVIAFETDVQLSKDRIPFLMHDSNSGFLLRTTNVKEKFRDTNFTQSTNWTWEQLQSLNAGEWFLKTDPFHSVSKLSEEEMKTARNQTIPSLLQLLNLAKQHNISVIFDLYNLDTENDTEDIVNTIFKSEIDRSMILWLPPVKRKYVKKIAPRFIQVYTNEMDMWNESGNYLNMKYSSYKNYEEIRRLRSRNVTVNMWVVNERWLFSLLWCAGASSVTTNSCHLLKDMEQPDWVMTPHRYRIIWIAVDIASIVIMTGLYIFQRKTHCFSHRKGTEDSTDEKEVSPLHPM